MNKVLKGVVASVLVGVVVLSATCLNSVKQSKAHNKNSNKYERNTVLSLDSNGELLIDRNHVGNEPMGKEDSWTLFVYI